MERSQTAAVPRRGKPLPWTLRERIAQLRRSGATLRAIAKSCGVAVNTVRRYSTIAQQV
jgi:DNA-binding CsgD family transcriptional regulator